MGATFTGLFSVIRHIDSGAKFVVPVISRQIEKQADHLVGCIGVRADLVAFRVADETDFGTELWIVAPVGKPLLILAVEHAHDVTGKVRAAECLNQRIRVFRGHPRLIATRQRLVSAIVRQASHQFLVERFREHLLAEKMRIRVLQDGRVPQPVDHMFKRVHGRLFSAK